MTENNDDVTSPDDFDGLFGGPGNGEPATEPEAGSQPKPAATGFADLFNELDNVKPAAHNKPAPATPPPEDVEETAAALAAFEETQQALNLKTEGRFEDDLRKPWMRFHKFNLAKTVEEVRGVVDNAIAHGRCGLDLETEGFDNRIDYIDGKPRTRHKIVGICLSVKGVAHYIPVRHKYNAPLGEKNPNVTPIEGVEAEIARLCRASQPVLTAEGQAKDPQASTLFETPPRVIIYFWHAKFDQEFLFPITGIDYWHPDSFEDGMLAAYALYTDDKTLGLKGKAPQRLRILDPKAKDSSGKPLSYPYEMIEFDSLFKQIKKADRHFQDLYPEDGNPVTLYGCSDAICTELLCEAEAEANWEYAEEPAGADYSPTTALMRKALYAFSYRLEKQTVQAVRIMERSRTLIDVGEIDRLLELADQELENCDKRILAQARARGFNDFNPSSPAQIAKFLFSEQGLDLKPKPDKTATGQYKTDADTLEKLAAKTGIDILKLFVRRRQVEKTKGTYLLGMKANCDESQQLRFNFKQVGTVTGRFSAPKGQPGHGFSGIPIQGIPRKHDPERPEVANSLRRVFIAKEGYVLAKVDYAGQELRILANLSKEPLWTKEFMEGDGDLHSLTTEAFFPGVQRGTPEFKEKRAMGKCVHPDTLVSLTDHLTPIRRLGVFPEEPDTFGDPQQEIHLCDGSAVEALYNGGRKPLVHVVGSGSIVTCTPEHRFLLRDGRFVRAGDLKPGDKLDEKAGLRASLWNGIPLSDLHHDLAYFAGIQRKREKNCRVPRWVLHAGREALLHYLGGLFDTDGTIGEQDRNLDWMSKDFVLAGQVATALRSCGLDFNVELTFNKTYQRYAQLRLTVGSSWEMRSYMRHAGKLSRLREPQQAARVKDRFEVVKVISAGEGPCLDITVANDCHRYLANGLMTHNTANFALAYGGGVQAIMRATKCDKVEAARKKAAFDKSVPVFSKWLKRQHAIVKKNYGVVSAFRRFIKIPDANIEVGDFVGNRVIEDEGEARKIRSGCERKSVNYPIQSSGADICKIALVKCAKEFIQRGWLRNGGDDSVRLLMTVHDEIVFEIRKDRLQQALEEVIIPCMEYPSTLAGWKIPLIVEPLVGPHWGSKHDWLKIMEGKEALPDFLGGEVDPGAGPPKPAPAVPTPVAPPTGQVPPEAAKTPLPSPDPEPTHSPPTEAPEENVATFALPYDNCLPRSSQKLIRRAIGAAAPNVDEKEAAKRLRLVDSGGKILIDPQELDILVLPDDFGRELRERNLGSGTFDTTYEHAG